MDTQEETLERETLKHLLLQLEEGGFFDKGEASSLVGSSLTNEELKQKILRAIDLAQVELAKYEQVIRDATSALKPIVAIPLVQTSLLNADFEPSMDEPLLMAPSFKPHEVCCLVCGIEGCNKDDCHRGQQLNGHVLHLPEIKVENPSDVRWTTNLGHHLLTSHEAKVTPPSDTEERKWLSEQLQQFEKFGVIKEGDAARILASPMTNQELRHFLINLVD